jgi:hypothetical protein
MKKIQQALDLVQALAAVNLFCKICDLVYEIRQSGCSWGITGCGLFSLFFGRRIWSFRIYSIVVYAV